jgi:hypothetical protein
MNQTSKPIQLDFNKPTQIIEKTKSSKISASIPSKTQLIAGQ